MILTVTLNPSIDISYPLEELKLDTVNRVSEVSKTAGGKGLNVTRVLAESGETVGATGFVGGTNGQFIKTHLPRDVQSFFYDILGDTRNCIAILHEGNQTEILEAGPEIIRTEALGFLHHFKLLMPTADVVAISAHHVGYHAFTEKYFFAPLITSLYIFPLSSQSHPTTTHNITGLHFN